MIRGITNARIELAEEEARRQTLRKVILRLGSKRFGSASGDVEMEIQTIDDMKELEALTEQVIDAASWDELLRSRKPELSSAYERGLEISLKPARKEMLDSLFHLGCKQFCSLRLEREIRIRAITDLSELQALLDRIFDVDMWNELYYVERMPYTWDGRMKPAPASVKPRKARTDATDGETFTKSFEQGMKDGPGIGRAAMRKSLLWLGRKRFGEPPSSIASAIDAIESTYRLGELARQLLAVQSWAELVEWSPPVFARKS